MTHPSTADLEAGAARVHASPSERGTVEMVVRRPDVDQRQVLDEGELVVGQGLAGDNYLARGSRETDDGSAHPEAQLNVMNAQAADLAANGDKEKWPLAGDQLFVDFNLSSTNAPTGTRLRVGTAVIEVTAKPHNGCAKFAQRFGVDAAKWANSSAEERYRGINAAVVEPGVVRPGDAVVKL